MTTLKDWNKYASDEDEQPVKKEKIKKTSIKIKNTHVVDPEWKEDREAKRREAVDKKKKLLRPEAPLAGARSRKIF